MFERQFGVSTRLYRNQRLTRDHVFEIAAHGFEKVELFAARTHLDYHNPSVIADLQQWLAEARVELHGVHAPVSDPSVSRPGEYMSIASADAKARGLAMAEVERALQIARRIPMQVFVLHLGWPRTHKGFGGSNRDAFGGGSRGYSGSNARAGSSRGSSSMGSRGGGGGVSRGGGGGRRR